MLMPLTSRLALPARFAARPAFADGRMDGWMMGPVVFEWAKAGVGSRHVTESG